MNPLAIYVFTQAGSAKNQVLWSILSAVGAVGLLGNYFIFLFLQVQKEIQKSIQKICVMENLTINVRTLSLADLPCCVLSLPLSCIQMFDIL